MNLHILVPCARPHLIGALMNDVAQAGRTGVEITVHVAMQSLTVPYPNGTLKTNAMIDEVPDDHWLWTFNDDTRIDPRVFGNLLDAVLSNEGCGAVVFAQLRRDGCGHPHRDGFTRLHARPDQVRVCWISGDQIFYRKGFLGDHRLRVADNEQADGKLATWLFREYPGRFVFVDHAYTTFNSMTWTSLPLGED